MQAFGSSLPLTHPEVLKMREIVRCPYCIMGIEFRPMVAHVDGRYICGKCGHTVFPSKPEYKCQCFKCLTLAVGVIAS